MKDDRGVLSAGEYLVFVALIIIGSILAVYALYLGANPKW